ncbi:hypothetical protein OW763_02195 [Clostridium aestuarii]|uniref:Carboxypeptidase regulatory-like domain-containing protein n=1 Tax=Clostridium aestuarii TaxID=338193 RepID=A0ABT4CW03_9CLOT|nr:hypothetical protein [Clostridium aestuarii]MCY6483165.1 hypothetical protein [Clostridium aestuarii]
MGARLTKYEFCPKPNEEIEAVIKVEHEPRAALNGIVLDWKDKPVKNAVVKLFERNKCDCGCKLKPITHTFTDECGQFIFGPLDPKKCYVIKVWFNDPVCSRDIVVKPSKCDNCCKQNHDNFMSKSRMFDDEEN